MGERRAVHLHVAGGTDAGHARAGDWQHELIAALEQCARGGPGAGEALRTWQGGCVPAMLRRMLDDPARASQTFDQFVADLADASDHGWEAGRADDWLFSRLRLYARGGGQAVAAPPRLHAVETVARPPDPEPMAAATVIAPRPVAHPPPEVDDAPEILNPRLRRPAAAAPAKAAAAQVRLRPRRRRWPRVLLSVLLCLIAAGIGFGFTVGGVAWLAQQWPSVTVEEPAPTPQPEPIQPPPAPSPPVIVQTAPPPSPEPPAASARETLGDPLAAREPEIEPLPADRPAAPAATRGPRIVVHYTGTDRDSAEVAHRLAEQLQRAGLGTSEARPVSFRIGSTSVRYFHAQDRGKADRLVAAVQPFLSWNGRAAPSTPIDFTDLRPLPQPGTLEIWLPGR